jgi:hypothetical protein
MGSNGYEQQQQQRQLERHPNSAQLVAAAESEWRCSTAASA